VAQEDRNDTRSQRAFFAACAAAAASFILGSVSGEPVFERVDRAGFVFAVTYLTTWSFFSAPQGDTQEPDDGKQTSRADRARKRGREILATLKAGRTRNGSSPQPDMQG